MEMQERTAVERELNRLMEMTLKLECELVATLNGYEEQIKKECGTLASMQNAIGVTLESSV